MAITISRIADVIELRVWASKKPVSLSSIKEELQTISAQPNKSPDVEDDEEMDEDEAAFVGKDTDSDDEDDDEEDAYYKWALRVFDEFERRSKITGDAYPFIIKGTSLNIKPNCANSDELTTYPFCLCLTLLTPSVITPMRNKPFESVAMKAAESYFSGIGVRTGAPWKTAAIQTYRSLLEKVCEIVSELEKPKAKVPAPKGGDNGWDFVVASRFPDERTSHLVVVGNCATGRKDFMGKGDEVSVGHFFSHFVGHRRSPLLKVFAVPFVLNDTQWSRKADEDCILFDRFRLAYHAPDVVTTSSVKWLKKHQATAESISFG